MNIDEYENGGRALYVDFAEAVAAILQAAVAEGNDLRLQNIQHRAKEVNSLRAKLAKSEAAADATIGDIAKDVAGCRLIFYTNGDVYLLYANPERMFDALIAMRLAATTKNERDPIDDLSRRFAQHDRRAWQQVGPGLQRLLIGRIADLDDAALVAAAPTATIMLREALSSTVTGTSWEEESVTLHSGSVAVTGDLKALRRDALHQLERLYGLLSEDNARNEIRDAMLTAGNTPNGAGYSDLLGEAIMDDLTHVVRFFITVVPNLGLEARRQLEVNLHHKFYMYHALPAGMADNADLVAAQARLVDAIMACRAALDDDPDLGRYRLLVGHDSVTPAMWTKPGFDFQTAAKDRSAAIDSLVASVDAASTGEWLARLDRFVETRSDDRANFVGLEEFIKKLAAAQPDILLNWMPQLSDRLANWLPGMLHGLSEAGHGAAVDPLIEAWVEEDIRRKVHQVGGQPTRNGTPPRRPFDRVA
ncbi:MAG: hypothetical protein ACK4K7_03730 [Allosphingosinicella sp.]|uniref:hypothetical protein n=1 Tax=Allosphingosinicella sp. TaxID=2823234 RepID=UPI00394115B9